MPQPVDVEIVVVDASGGAVPTAAVVFPIEDDPHVVVSATGAWSGRMLHLPDGSDLVLTKGLRLDFAVVAPGWRLHEGVLVVGGGRRDRVIVTLERLVLDLEAAPSPAADAAAALRRWEDSARAWLAHPDAETRRAMIAHRSATAEHAERWLAWVDSEGGARGPAEEICRLASSAPERCRG